MTLARADRAHARVTEDFDGDPWLLNTPAGTVDLRTGRVARTEVLQSLHEGTRAAWKQAAEHLGPGTRKEWIASGLGSCPICAALDGKKVPLGGQFKAKGRELAGPLAHPRCRCTAVAVPADVVAGLRRLAARKR